MKNGYFEVKDLKKKYSVHQNTVYRWLELHLMPHQRIGGRRLISQTDVDAFEKKGKVN